MTNKDIAGNVLPMPADKFAEFAEAIKNMKETLPLQIQFQAMRAALNWEFYTQLIEAGFDEQKALELVKAKGV